MTSIDLPKSDLHRSDACLTAHMLDLATGRPADGIKVDLLRHLPDRLDLVASAFTNSDGRLPSPLLTRETAETGRYSLAFAVNNGFFNTVPVEFEITDTSKHHHVPLVLSPYGYSTYRGAPPHRAPSTGFRKENTHLTIPEQAAPPPGSMGPGMTVHVIDISCGGGAGGMAVEVRTPSGTRVSNLITNAEGRTTEWLIAPDRLEKGAYEIRFDFDQYFTGQESGNGMISFFPCARVCFHVSDPTQHYHIPLLAAPWGYTCYRGS